MVIKMATAQSLRYFKYSMLGSFLVEYLCYGLKNNPYPEEKTNTNFFCRLKNLFINIAIKKWK